MRFIKLDNTYGSVIVLNADQIRRIVSIDGKEHEKSHVYMGAGDDDFFYCRQTASEVIARIRDADQI